MENTAVSAMNELRKKIEQYFNTQLKTAYLAYPEHGDIDIRNIKLEAFLLEALGLICDEEQTIIDIAANRIASHTLTEVELGAVMSPITVDEQCAETREQLYTALRNTLGEYLSMMSEVCEGNVVRIQVPIRRMTVLAEIFGIITAQERDWAINLADARIRAKSSEPIVFGKVKCE